LPQSANGTQLYWLASDGNSSVLFSGSTADGNGTVVLDLSTLATPSLHPSTLAVSDSLGFAIWVDKEQNSVYRVGLLSLNVTLLSFPIGVQELVSAAIDSGSGAVYVLLWEGSNTRIAVLAADFTGISSTVYFKRGVPCCGMVQAFAVQSLGALECPAGTYTAACLPCASGTFATEPLGKLCAGNALHYCLMGIH
jgi:hypothetical protein